MKGHIAAGFLLFALASTLYLPQAAAQAPVSASAGFDAHVARVEAQMLPDETSPTTFLGLDGKPSPADLKARLRGGALIYERGNRPTEVPGGLVHDWVGLTFIPNTGIEQVVEVLQDSDHLSDYYRPEVVNSRLLSRSGDDFSVTMRLRKHKVITVLLDTDYAVHFGQLDSAHRYSVSRSTRIREVHDPDNKDERELPPGEDHGFLWRMNTYWRFVQQSDGVLAECEAISLTRRVPTGLGWLIGPYLQSIPRESLQFTLDATRAAALKKNNVPQQARAAHKGIR